MFNSSFVNLQINKKIQVYIKIKLSSKDANNRDTVTVSILE